MMLFKAYFYAAAGIPGMLGKRRELEGILREGRGKVREWLKLHGISAREVALTALELLVAFLQAYVFAILTCIYLNDAIHPGH